MADADSDRVSGAVVSRAREEDGAASRRRRLLLLASRQTAESTALRSPTNFVSETTGGPSTPHLVCANCSPFRRYANQHGETRSPRIGRRQRHRVSFERTGSCKRQLDDSTIYQWPLR